MTPLHSSLFKALGFRQPVLEFLGLLLPVLLLLGLLLLPLLARATPGTLSRGAVLRTEARDNGSVVQQLDKGASVNVLVRDGGWYRVDYNGQRGWLRLYWVRTGGALVARASGAPLRSISDSLAAVRARSMQNQIHATIGVRGMSEEELKAAHYDAAQMTKLDTLMVSRADAATFAAAAPVRSRAVDELQAGVSARTRR